MKLHALKEKISIVRGDQAESSQFGIDGKNMHLAIQAFYQYSDPIGSIIREITSNAYDAHIEADVDKAVIIRLNTAEQTLNILDFGVGLSPERIRDVFTKFFSSTKRESDTQIGAFGLGAKSPLSYTDTFQVITKYGDTIYEYAVLKNDGVPDMIKIEEHTFNPETDVWDNHLNSTFPWKQDENGTLISIPYEGRNEGEIRRSLRKQLCYFDNVVIDNADFEDYNQETIHRGNSIIYRKTEDRNYGIDSLHICMGKVLYPLSYLFLDDMDDDVLSTLREEAYEEYVKETSNIPKAKLLKKTNSELRFMLRSMLQLPIGLYFDIGELPILWHRENVEYTDGAKKTIVVKAIKALLELSFLQEKRVGVVDTMEKALKAIRDEEDTSLLYMSSRAKRVTGFSINVQELEDLVSLGNGYSFSHIIADPVRFIGKILYPIDNNIFVRDEDLVEGLCGKKDGRVPYRIEPGEKRKAKLKAFMKAKGMSPVMSYKPFREFLHDLTYNGNMELKEAEKDIIKKYYNETLTLFNRLPEANEIEISSKFFVAKTASVSQLPLLWRHLNGATDPDYSYTRTDFLSNAYHSPKGVTMLIYGHASDRKLLNAYAGFGNVESVHRPKFGGNAERRTILGIISENNVEAFSEHIPTVVHIHAFLSHRRGIANLATKKVLDLYVKKYPWFKYMLRYKTGAWSSLRGKRLITEEEYQRIFDIGYSLYGYSSSPELEPYVTKAIQKRMFHYDELQDVQWLHGMYCKYAFALSNELITSESPSESPANSYYTDLVYKHVPFTINPILYRRYHVKYIENEN